MASNTISSATSAAKQMQLPRQATQTESAKNTEVAAKAKKAQPQQAQQAEQPQPVTNLQGQRTGTLINLIA